MEGSARQARTNLAGVSGSKSEKALREAQKVTRAAE
jgi:hypothetical protein